MRFPIEMRRKMLAAVERGEAFRAVTPEECANYFRSCGYGM